MMEDTQLFVIFFMYMYMCMHSQYIFLLFYINFSIALDSFYSIILYILDNPLVIKLNWTNLQVLAIIIRNVHTHPMAKCLYPLQEQPSLIYNVYFHFSSRGF